MSESKTEPAPTSTELKVEPQAPTQSPQMKENEVETGSPKESNTQEEIKSEVEVDTDAIKDSEALNGTSQEKKQDENDNEVEKKVETLETTSPEKEFVETGNEDISKVDENENPSEDKENETPNEEEAAKTEHTPTEEAIISPTTSNEHLETRKEYIAPEPTPHKDRIQSHEKLRCYESRRRKAYLSKLSSSSLYWRSFRELIHESLDETIRAERIVYAHVAASEDHAFHIKAIHTNVLDENFRPILDEKKRNKMMAILEQENGAVKKNQKGEFKLGDMDGMEKPTTGQLLNSMIESQSILADKYEEYSISLKEDVSSEMTSLRMQLEKQITHMETLGDAILAELIAAEKEVLQAWEKYYNESQKNIPNGKPPLLASTIESRRGAMIQKTKINDNRDLSPLPDCSDLWVHEMHYRMAVAFLSTCWEKCSGELSRLFASMKETESSRRSRLRELLVLFLQMEERLWMSLPSVMSPVLKELTDRSMDRDAISEDVQNTIRLRAQDIQRKEESEMKKLMSGPGLSTELVKDGNFELSSPLASDELYTVKVIETKNAGMMRPWKTVLAVITNDSFLHLFLLPLSLHLHPGSDPEMAFHGLVPPVEIPTDENMHLIKSSKLTPKKWNENLKPYLSLILPNSRIYFEDNGENTAFELTESVFNHGANKVFGKVSDRKIFCRTQSIDETNELISLLKANK